MGNTAVEKVERKKARVQRGVVPSLERTLNENMRTLKQDIIALGDRAKGMNNPKLAAALYALGRATEDEGALNRVASNLLESVELVAGRDEDGKLHARPEE